MNGFRSNFSNFVRKMDLFPTTQLIHYKGLDAYKTYAGGGISLVLILILVGLAVKETMVMLQREVTSFEAFVSSEVNPSNLTVSFSPGASFMFALTFNDYESGVSYREYFDVVAIQISKNYTEFNTSKNGDPKEYFLLEPCTIAHFSFSTDTLDVFNRMELGRIGLCPPLNRSIFLAGRKNSPVSNRLNLMVVKCFNTARNCTSNSSIANLEAENRLITMGVPYINTIINPQSKEYLDVYVDDYHEFFITSTMAPFVEAQIASYTI